MKKLFEKGNKPWNKNKPNLAIKGEKNYNWKGGLDRFPKCEICGKLLSAYRVKRCNKHRLPLSKEHKEKIGKSLKGIKRPKISEEHRKKLSESHKGKNTYKRNEETRRKMSNSRKGKNVWNWKGGIETENKKIRKGIEFRLWREAVFARDSWICQKCKIKGGKLHPHHIQNFAQFLELRFAIDNGITFCQNCHQEFHKIYRKTNNTKEQINKYLYEKI